jgi:hypothetical protein
MVRRLCVEDVSSMVDVYVNVNRHHATAPPARGSAGALIVNPWRAECSAAR